MSRKDEFLRWLTFRHLGTTIRMWVILVWEPEELGAEEAEKHAWSVQNGIYDFLRWCVEHRDEIQKLKAEQLRRAS